MSPARKGQVLATAGIASLIAGDPCRHLVYAVEQVQKLAGHRRLRRVLARTRRRRNTIGWIHASDAAHPCDRLLGALLLGYDLRAREPTPRLERIFENGHMMHLRWQNAMMSLPAAYAVEISPLLRCWPIVGEADAIIEHSEFGRIIIELKSINDNGFKALRSTPQLAHIAQVGTYVGLDAAGASPHVWYENKNDQDVRAFCAACCPALHESASAFAATHERLLGIADAVAAGGLPNGCGDPKCIDDEIAALRLDERRFDLLRQERDRATT
jgi:hypothetical protein